MKRKKMRILLSIFLLLCTLLSSMDAMAADERLGEVVGGSLLTEDVESEGIAHSRLRGAFLSYGTGGIANSGNKRVSISGRTVCYSTCDKVKVTVHLQRLVGNSWVTIATLGPKTATNTYTVSASNTYKVTGGYYYRVSGGHVAFKDGGNEAVASFSNGIWISK